MKKMQLSGEELRHISESLEMLMHAGISPADGFTMLAEDEKGGYSELLRELAGYCASGYSLSESLKKSEAFPAYMSSLIEVGEKTGRLEKSLSALAQFYDNRLRLERQIKTALLYPALLLIIMFIVIGVLLVEVLPLFDKVYGQMGSSLTGIAGVLLALGKVIKSIMPAICILVAVAAVLMIMISFSGSFRNSFLGFWKKNFGDKGVWEKINIARTAQAISMSVSSGLAIEDALTMAAKLTEDIPSFQKRCLGSIEDLSRGETLSDTLSRNRILPKTECRLLEVGMRGGLGDDAMQSIAERLLEESEYALASKISRIEPCIIVITAGAVGLILLSVMMPLVQIMASLG